MTRTVQFSCVRTALKEMDYQSFVGEKREIERLGAALNDCFRDAYVTCAVLGVDVYQYSRLPRSAQEMIPSLLKLIRDETLATCHTSEGFIFHAPESTGPYVSTGDGGFHVFATPLHALVFAIYFQLYVAAYNSGHYLPRLRRILKHDVVLRYALTYDELFVQDDNVFGAAVIANSRIMSRDSLNRCLLDSSTVQWFQNELVSIESLLTVEAADIERLTMFSENTSRADASRLFGSRRGATGIRAIHLQDIGVVPAKKNEFHVHSLMIQVAVPKGPLQRTAGNVVVVTIGNLNPAGISV